MLTDFKKILNRFIDGEDCDIVLVDLYKYIDNSKNPIYDFYAQRHDIIETLIKIADVATYKELSSESRNMAVRRLEGYILKMTEIFEYLNIVGYMDSDNKFRVFRKEKLKNTVNLFYSSVKNMLSCDGLSFNRYHIRVVDGELEDCLVRSGAYRRLEILSASVLREKEVFAKHRVQIEDSFRDLDFDFMNGDNGSNRKKLTMLNTHLKMYSSIDKLRSNPSSKLASSILEINCKAKEAFEETCRDFEAYSSKSMADIYLDIQKKMFRVENLGKAIVALEGIEKIKREKMKEADISSRSSSLNSIQRVIANLLLFVSSHFSEGLLFLS